MSGPRPTLSSTLVMGAVAAVTTWAALTAWHGFLTEPGTYLRRLAAVALVVGVLGALLRWRNLPRWVVALVQTVAAAALVTYQITGSPLFFGAPGAEVGGALRDAMDAARTYAAPISPQAGPVWPLLVASGAAFIVIVDVVACTYRKVPAAGLALLAVYSVPSGLLEGGPGWGSFVVAAIGFLALLHFDARDQLQRWGRTIGPDDNSMWGHGNPVREAARAGAARIGITATALALVVPAFMPVIGVDIFDFGTGQGNGDIRIRKPIADMRRDLEREQDVPLIEIETNDPDPEYLRVAVLNRFTGQEWSNGDRDVDRENTASGALPPPPGLADSVPRTEYDYQLDISERFDSTWLPTQFPAASVDAEGDWRFDPATMDFLAAKDNDTRGLSYSMTSLEPDYGTDGRYFLNSRTGDVSEEVLELPRGVPAIVRDLARSVTAPASSDYESALLLQRWFRRDGGFLYDVSRAPDGTGNGTFEAFLSPQGRVGYCEQYASAMAVMARTLGIPARVAVGFLEPTPLGDGRWEYSSHDLHAWPELYFSGTGWVRFEPTPSERVEDVPDYSRVPVNGIGEEPSIPTNSTAQSSSGTATVAPTTRPADPNAEDPNAGQDENDGRSTLQRVLIVLGVLALVLLLIAGLLFGPRSLRQQARRSRLDGGPDDVWSELRATATDLGVPWPDGRSPREVGAVLVEHLADPDGPAEERPRTGPDVAPDAAQALERLVLHVERARYARPGAIATLERSTLSTDAEMVAAAIAAGVTPRERRRAQWLPRSMWKRRG